MSLCIIPDYKVMQQESFFLVQLTGSVRRSPEAKAAHPLNGHQRLLYVGLPKFFDSSASVLAALSFTRMLCTPLKRDLDCKGSAGEYNALRKMASPKYCLHDSDSTEYGVEPTAIVEINRTGIEVSFPLRTMPCRTPHLTP